MKKLFAFLLVVVMILSMMVGCGNNTPPGNDTDTKKIETLKVAFVPSREPAEIITVTEPLKAMLKEELAKEGYEVGEVEITVGTTYEAVGEGLEAGTIDVGLIPGGTYVLYDDGAEVILTATRNGLSKDSDNAKDWNDGQPTEASEKQAVSYRALMIAGPSDKGQELLAKVNNGEELTWEDLNSANWSVMGTSSPAGYIYPALWLQDHYGKGISDLASAVQSDSYASAFARLASGQVDVLGQAVIPMRCLLITAVDLLRHVEQLLCGGNLDKLSLMLIPKPLHTVEPPDFPVVDELFSTGALQSLRGRFRHKGITGIIELLPLPAAGYSHLCPVIGKLIVPRLYPGLSDKVGAGVPILCLLLPRTAEPRFGHCLDQGVLFLRWLLPVAGQVQINLPEIPGDESRLPIFIRSAPMGALIAEHLFHQDLQPGRLFQLGFGRPGFRHFLL